MLEELLGLLADINPAEIASHVAQGNLHEWCDSWRSAAEQAVLKMDNRVPVTSWSNEDLVRRSDLDCRGLAFLRHADGSDYTQYERGYNDAVISIYGMISSAPCATKTIEIDSRLDERDAKITLALADSHMRERLIILLNDHTCLEEEGCKDECTACLADHPIANGVTIREEGRWKSAGMGDYRCSLCDETVSGNHHNYRPSYCPIMNAPCDKEKCGWWSEDSQKCAILVAAESLKRR